MDINITKESLEQADSMVFEFTDYLGIKKRTDMSDFLEKCREFDLDDLKSRIKALMVEYSRNYWVKLCLDDDEVAWIQWSQI